MKQSFSLFSGVLARGPVPEAVCDRAWLQAMLDTEAALARVQASLGTIAPEHAEAIAGICDAGRYDITEIARAAAGPGNPVLPLVQAMRAALPHEVAASVHFGATSQDILDTAAMLVAHRALGPLLADLARAGAAAARLARAHRQTPMAGRTLLQQAEPVTFGMTAAVWMAALDEAADRLIEVRRTRLAVQIGGAVGRLTGWQRGLAERLGLAEPLIPWHTNRLRVVDLAAALGGAAGVAGKVARDITLLAQTEVGEVSEADPGESSAMPHKRNPIAAIAASGCAAQAPGLVATLFAAMPQEHGRAAGAWHAEWHPLRELLISTGSAVAWLNSSLTGLKVHTDALATNLARLARPDVDACVRDATVLLDRALTAHDSREVQR